MMRILCALLFSVVAVNAFAPRPEVNQVSVLTTPAAVDRTDSFAALRDGTFTETTFHSISDVGGPLSANGVGLRSGRLDSG